MMRQQSNSIHASVGVIIAIVANTWAGRIVPPFLWGFIWCARLALLPGGPVRQRGRNMLLVYAAEYVRAVFPALSLSLFVGSFKALFRYAVLS
jgi:hypothetical protein